MNAQFLTCRKSCSSDFQNYLLTISLGKITHRVVYFDGNIKLAQIFSHWFVCRSCGKQRATYCTEVALSALYIKFKEAASIDNSSNVSSDDLLHHKLTQDVSL